MSSVDGSPSENAEAPGLTPEQIAAYERDGYLILYDWLDAATCASLRARAHELLRTEATAHAEMCIKEGDGVSVFSTENTKQNRDAYFLGSGDKVRYFFEEGALDACVRTGDFSRAADFVNKIGHNLHELVPEFRAVSFSPRVASVLRALSYTHPAVPQSMYILKSARVGGAVRPHQDGTFLYTSPQSVIGLWWPLEDCTQTNGCLWAVPGSHTMPVARRFVRTGEDDHAGTHFEPAEEVPFDVGAAVPLETPAGSLVLLHAALVHFSHANTSGASRNAYSIHVVEGAPHVEYPADNWLQRPGRAPFPYVY